MARALFENTCYAIRTNLELLQEFTEIKLGSCTVAGGLTRSHLWLQMLADVTGLDIHCGHEVEASSLGAAMCAAIAVGRYDSFFSASKAMVKRQAPIRPRMELHEKYNTFYTRWQTLYKQSANL